MEGLCAEDVESCTGVCDHVIYPAENEDTDGRISSYELRRKRKFRAFSDDYWHIECKTVTNRSWETEPNCMGNAYSTGIFSNLNVRLDARFPPQRILEGSHIKIEG